MGKKKEKEKKKKKRKAPPLEKKLRKLEKEGMPAAEIGSAAGAHADLVAAAAAAAPAEVQLGGGEMIGSLAHAAGATQATRDASQPAASGGDRAQPGAGPGVTAGEGQPAAAPAPAPAVAARGVSWADAPPGATQATASAAPRADGRPAYDLFTAVRDRRSHKRFLKRPVPRRALEVLFEAAVLAPNHKLTEPWGFVVLGERARRRYGEIRARVKVGEDADGKAEKRARIIDEVVSIPAIIAVTMHVDDDEVRREEDHAATFMAVQNLLLAGTALGLGTKINTGRIMDHPELRALVGARDDERIVALINVGVPAETRGPPTRTAAARKTRWLD